MGAEEACRVLSGIPAGAAGGTREGLQRGALEFMLLKWEMSFSSRKAMCHAAGRCTSAPARWRAGQERAPAYPGAGLPGRGGAVHGLMNSGQLTKRRGVCSGLLPPSLDHGTAHPGPAAHGTGLRVQSLHFLCL